MVPPFTTRFTWSVSNSRRRVALDLHIGIYREGPSVGRRCTRDLNPVATRSKHS